MFLAGAVLFGLRLYAGDSLFAALTAFMRVAATATPLTAFFMISLPVIAANRVGRKCSSALIGNAVGEEYADASVISFADTEVYPSNLVKITSIKTYGDYRIDMAVSDLARAFAFIGGPLSKVVSNMLSEPGTEAYSAIFSRRRFFCLPFAGGLCVDRAADSLYGHSCRLGCVLLFAHEHSACLFHQRRQSHRRDRRLGRHLSRAKRAKVTNFR